MDMSREKLVYSLQLTVDSLSGYRLQVTGNSLKEKRREKREEGMMYVGM